MSSRDDALVQLDVAGLRQQLEDGPPRGYVTLSIPAAERIVAALEQAGDVK